MIAVAMDVAAAILKDHQGCRDAWIVLGWDVDPVAGDHAIVDAADVSEPFRESAGGHSRVLHGVGVQGRLCGYLGGGAKSESAGNGGDQEWLQHAAFTIAGRGYRRRGRVCGGPPQQAEHGSLAWRADTVMSHAKAVDEENAGVSRPGPQAEEYGTMIELTCVACGAKESIPNQKDQKRARTCGRCGQSLIEMRAPGSMQQAEPRV